MANAVYYSNVAQQTTLSGSISSGATSVPVGATTGFPGFFPYTLAVDYGAATEELVSVTAAAGTSLTVIRGYGGTSAQSHSLGAVVRHVYNAQDATDFRTHEAATAAVHGVAGTLVGTSDVQTLSSKTLTNPTINAGALSGTFTGTPTFSGDVTHTGQILAQNLVRGSRALATDSQYEARVVGDTSARWFMLTTGEQRWGSGSGLTDVSLSRPSSSTLQTDSQFRSKRPLLTDTTWISQSNADTGSRWYMTAGGTATWGDGAGAMDTNLYRSGAGTLKTDGALTVTGDLQAGNIYTATQDPWTPTWTTSSGTHLPSYGNAVVVCRFSKVGRMVFFSIDITFGSTTNFGAGATTGDNWRFSVPVTAARGGAVCGWLATRPASSNSTMGHIQIVGSDTSNFELHLDAGAPGAVATAQVGVMDSLTPHTWANGDRLVAGGFYEAAF